MIIFMSGAIRMVQKTNNQISYNSYYGFSGGICIDGNKHVSAR